MQRLKPNILITGTPGTGKTTTCALLAETTGFKHVNIGDLVKKDSLHSGWDDDYECYVIDEDKVRFLLMRGMKFRWLDVVMT
jgi:adenylate kinase